MKITCPHCGATARITHSVSITPESKDVYANCQSSACGARFVVSVAFKYDIVPPAAKFKSMVSELLSKVSETDRTALMKKYALTQGSLF